MAERNIKGASLQKALFGEQNKPIDIGQSFGPFETFRIFPPKRSASRFAMAYVIRPDGSRAEAECIDGGVRIEELSNIKGLDTETRFTGPVIASEPVGTPIQLIAQVDFPDRESICIYEPGTDGRVGIWDTKINPLAQTVLKIVSGENKPLAYTYVIDTKENITKRVELNVRNFTHDVMSYLKKTPQALDPLFLDAVQQQVFNALLQSDVDALYEIETLLKDNDNPPYMAKIYHSAPPEPEYDRYRSPGENIERILKKFVSVQFSLVVRFGLREGFSPTFDFAGDTFSTFGHSITLIGLPKQIETEQEASALFNSFSPSTYQFSYEISPDGLSVCRHDIGKPKPGYGERLDLGLITTSFHYLGSLFGPRSKREYFIYGTNDYLGLLRRRGE